MTLASVPGYLERLPFSGGAESRPRRSGRRVSWGKAMSSRFPALVVLVLALTFSWSRMQEVWLDR